MKNTGCLRYILKDLGLIVKSFLSQTSTYLRGFTEVQCLYKISEVSEVQAACNLIKIVFCSASWFRYNFCRGKVLCHLSQ